MTENLPSNEKIDKALEKGKEALEKVEQEAPAAPKAKVITRDVKDVLDDAQQLLKQKNRGDKLQKILAYGSKVNESGELTKQAKEAKGAVEKQVEPLKQEGNVLFYSIRNLSWQLVTSRDFRETLLDFLGFLQNLLSNVRERQAQEQVFPPPMEAAKFDFKEGFNTFPTTQESIKEAFRQVGDEMREPKNMTQEEKDELRARFRRLMSHITRNENLSTAANSLFNIMDNYLKPMLEDLNNKVTKPRDENLWNMWNETKGFIEEFTNGKSVDDFMNKFWEIYRFYQEDPELRQFWHDLREFFNDALRNPEMLDSDSMTNRADELFERGRRLFDSDTHRQKLRELMDEANDLLKRIQNDDVIQRFNEDITKLARDIAYDDGGRPSLAQLQESVTQLRTIIQPLLVQMMQEVPVPVLEGTTDKYRYRIENVAFTGGNIIPEQIRFHLDTDTYLKLQDELAPSEIFALLRVNIDNINANIKDVKFWLHKFKGSEWTDWGVFDADIKGVSFEFTWRIRSVGGRPWRFYLENVNCTIGSLKFKIREAKHEIWDKIMTTLFIFPMKKRFARSIEEFLVDKLRFLDKQFNQMFFTTKGYTRTSAGKTLEGKMEKMSLKMETPTKTTSTWKEQSA